MARLADQVPAGDLDRADRRHDRRAPWYWSRIMPPIERLDVERVAAQHASFDPFVKERLDGFFLPLERGFADARQSGIGAQANEQIIPQTGVGQKRFEADDLHAGFSSRNRSQGLQDDRCDAVDFKPARRLSRTIQPRSLRARCDPVESIECPVIGFRLQWAGFAAMLVETSRLTTNQCQGFAEREIGLDERRSLSKTSNFATTALDESAGSSHLGPLPGTGSGLQPGGHHLHPPRRLRDRLGRVQGRRSA